MSHVSGDPLAEVLVDAGVLTREQMDRALAARSNGVERVEEVIARLGLAREEEIYTAVAERLGLEFVPKVERDIAEELLTLVPSDFAMRHQVLPLREEDHTLVVAVANPFDVTVLDDLRLLTNRDVRPVVAVPRQISEGIENSYMEKMFRDIDDLQTEEVADEDLESGHRTFTSSPSRSTFVSGTGSMACFTRPPPLPAISMPPSSPASRSCPTWILRSVASPRTGECGSGWGTA